MRRKLTAGPPPAGAMQVFSSWSEQQARRTRWVLLLGWLGLILSLLLPGVDPWPFELDRCGPLMECHGREGNQIFWGLVVPSGLLILVALSHEVWRRICPLAFVSQLFRALHWQRTVPGKGGRRDVVKIEADSWLGQHHVQLQWSLFIAGLSLRLLVVNSSPFGLGLFLALTVAAALAVGWAYGGKAWCQYFCPMAPVQAVVTGPRSLLGSPAHLETTSRITQSMCRTIGEQGKLQSACVACQAPCIDIDSERAYWQTFRGKKGLAWAWASYPGLVLAFFLLIRAAGPGGIDYLRTGMWAYDARAVDQIAQPLVLGGWNTLLPRWFTMPALLVLGGVLSVALFGAVERWLRSGLAGLPAERATAVAGHRTRLAATFLAVNIFFWFADPSLGLLGPRGGQLIRSLVLVVSGMWLYRGWSRDKATYTRESTSASLRKQLEKLVPEMGDLLDGRSLAELSPGEVFTLAKVLPSQISQTKRGIYREVLSDLFGSGRLDRAAALVQLEELRQSLDLKVEDHHAAVRELAVSDPRILQLDHRQREIRSLRQEAADEAIEDLLETTGLGDLSAALADGDHGDRLERIRQEYALDEASWSELLASFGTASSFARGRVEEQLQQVRDRLAARQALAQAAADEPLLRPLLPVIDRELVSLFVTVAPSLQPFAAEDPLVERFQGLLPHVPEGVLTQLRRQDRERWAPASAEVPAPLDPLPDPAEVLDGLWRDPDPDTALWALWVQDQRDPARAAALRREPRVGLPSSAALERLRSGEGLALGGRLRRLLEVPLMAGLSPAALINMLHWGEERQLPSGEVLFSVGDPPDTVAILLEGRCEVRRPSTSDGGLEAMARIHSGEPIGEVSFLVDHPRHAEVRAIDGPATVLVFESSEFEQLLQQSSEFNRGLLHTLALRLEDSYGKLGTTTAPR